MLRKILLVIVLVFLITGIGFAFQNEPDGFRGLKWGDPPTEDMTFDGQNVDKQDLYYRKSDKLNIGSVELNGITYRFFNKKEFLGVSGKIGSENDFDLLEIFCRERFGKPTRETEPILNDRKGMLEWYGEKSWINLVYYPIEALKIVGCLSISSRFAWEERERAYKEKESKEKEGKDGEQEGVGKKKPIILFGTGQEASEKFVLEEGLVRFNFLYKGQHNFIVWLLDNTGKKVELLVNKTGYFDGSKAIRIDKTGIYLLDISADEYWLVTIFSG